MVVLVVEDNLDLQLAIAKAAGPGYELRFAATASAAMRDVEAVTPRLVILDYGLPDQDGLTVLRHLRQRDATKRIPVVMFSDSRDPLVIDAALQAGANSWIPKPTDPTDLTRCVKDLLAPLDPISWIWKHQ